MKPGLYKKLGYVSEIDGFRAVAVIAVVIFHLDKEWLPGGFLGVDLFFVISGYLITGILLNKSEKSVKRNIREFYQRRVRRIFPVFFFVVLATLVASYFFLLPDAYQVLSESAISSLFFVSNIYFYLNTGYFDVSSDTMPLLHTWSLAVEEQFYIIWPIVLLVISKHKKDWLIPLAALAFFSSLAGSVLVTKIDSQLAFFNFPFRAFQFLSGAIIPIAFSSLGNFRKPALSGFFQALGLVVVFLSLFVFSENSPFPGWLALIPTLGAFLFLVGASFKERPKNNPVNIRLVNYIGRISFSVYLWHWPLIALWNVYSGHEARQVQDQFFLIGLTLVLSVFSYHLIEVPFRKKIVLFYRPLIFIGIACLVFSLVSIYQNGLASRIPEWEASPTTSEVSRMKCEEYPGFGDEDHCYLPPQDSTKKTFLLWGDYDGPR